MHTRFPSAGDCSGCAPRLSPSGSWLCPAANGIMIGCCSGLLLGPSGLIARFRGGPRMASYVMVGKAGGGNPHPLIWREVFPSVFPCARDASRLGSFTRAVGEWV
jgi:hypothetical protein